MTPVPWQHRLADHLIRAGYDPVQVRDNVLYAEEFGTLHGSDCIDDADLDAAEEQLDPSPYWTDPVWDRVAYRPAEAPTPAPPIGEYPDTDRYGAVRCLSCGCAWDAHPADCHRHPYRPGAAPQREQRGRLPRPLPDFAFRAPGETTGEDLCFRTNPEDTRRHDR